MNYVEYRIIHSSGVELDFELSAEEAENRIAELNNAGGEYHLKVVVGGEENNEIQN